jgi:dihydrofolate synthase/folylpolyglutamate synthase
MHAALDALDHPEEGLPVVHVAGTNGKGSVCAMMTAIGQAAGLRTGTFTSPHLCRLAERIRLDLDPIGDDAFAEALERVLHPSIPEVTFFEAMTLAAFVAMRAREVDLAIFEVGLGGRLDATNVVRAPLATAVVSVALDHTRILGSDLATIAREKAAIAKPDVPMVLGPLTPDARQAAIEVAREAGASPVWWVATEDDDVSEALRLRFADGDDGLRVDSPRGEVEALTLGLGGLHQHANAAVAVGLAHQLADRGILEDVDGAVRAGLASASWPGRLERIERGDVTILLDCAHNPHAAEALAAALTDQPIDRTRLVFGALGDKAWPRMLATLGPLAHQRYYCEPIEELAGRRPAPPSALADAMPGRVASTPRQALQAALADARPGETIVVAGSIFLTGAARAFLLGIDDDPAVPL